MLPAGEPFRPSFDVVRESAMTAETIRGRFVWHELITPDAAAAHGFYTKVVGWKTQPWEYDSSYTMWVGASGPLGGTVARPSESARWLPYIGTDYIEGVVDKARSLGARVIKDVTDMPSGGKLALLEDPQGAAFGVYRPPNLPTGERGQAKLGEYVWHELATTDYQAAFEFYSALFGWEETGRHEMGAAEGTYFMFGRNGVAMGGMFKRPSDLPGEPAWLSYIRVKDVAHTIRKATSAGAQLLSGPIEVPGGDRIAQLTDPQGGLFAVVAFASEAIQPAQEEAAGADQGATEEAQARATGAARRRAAKQVARKQATDRPKKSTKKKVAKKATKKAAGRAAVKKKAVKKPVRAAKKKTAKPAARSKAKAKSSARRGSAARSAKRSARKSAGARKARRPAERRGKPRKAK